MLRSRAKSQAEKFLQILSGERVLPSRTLIQNASSQLSAAGAQVATLTNQLQASRPTLNQLVSRVSSAIQPVVESATSEVQVGVQPLLNRVSGYLTQVDTQWQQFIQTRVDPLFGQTRDQQFGVLATGLSDAEKDINRRLLVALGNLGVAAAATTIFTPLALVNAGAMVWSFLPMYKRGVQVLVKEHRLTYNIVLMGAQAAMILGGHFVAGSIAVLVVSGANKIILRTEDHFRRDISEALGQQPSTVWRLVDGVEIKTPLASIRQGDLLVFSAGEVVAVDGTITEGHASIDQHRLTGESQPVEKTRGDQVLASTMLLTGKIQVVVQRTGIETSAAQIAVILQRVGQSRISFTSRMQNFVDGMALPMLTIGGIALATLGTGGAAAVMSVGVGSVARFGGPIAMLNYLNVAARHGVLIKDARSLEILKKVDTIVFDKTGTLTLERPQIRRIHRFPIRLRKTEAPDTDYGWLLTEEELLCYAAAVEQKQSHPIAQAILTESQMRGLMPPQIDDTTLNIGYGIKGQVTKLLGSGSQPTAYEGGSEQLMIHVGSQRFMELEGVALPAELTDLQNQCHAEGHSLVVVALDHQVVGAIELHPTLRPEAHAAITTLRERGLELYILSGDHATPTRRLAEELGIEHYIAGVLPQEKAEVIERLKAEGRTVCFIGDGINDSLGLFKADTSVSLRGASTLATDTAQIVLMSQDLRQMAFLLTLAKEFDQSLQQLFTLTLIPVSTVVASTFLLGTGINFATFAWQLGMLSGIGMGFLPLQKYPSEPSNQTR